MDSTPHETRPLKRRRMDMVPPFGFATTTARKPVFRPVVPRFASAFNKDCTAEPPSNSSSTKERTPVLSNSSTTESTDKLKERRSVLHTLVPSKPIQFDTRPYASRISKDRPSAFLPALHRPSALLKPAVPPPSLLVNKHSSKGLKSLQPPPAPLPPNPATDGKALRMISKTRVALATDLSTDNGVTELASVFLHDQHPDITLPNSRPDNHDRRGLELSPEKKDKGKSYKFVRYVLVFWQGPYNVDVVIRGGLAARASAFFEQCHTSLVLWQKETERHASTSFSDLRVNIIKILQQPLRSPTACKQLISPGIALCRIRRETNNTSSYSYHKSYSTDHVYRIVFSFPSYPIKSLFNDPHEFSEGRTVRICWPWQEISFMEESSASNLPASLPLPSFEPTLTPNVAVDDTALLCSRFFILKNPV